MVEEGVVLKMACSLLNSYRLNLHIHPLEHKEARSKNWDFLKFGIEVVNELVGSFSSWQQVVSIDLNSISAWMV